MYFTVCRYYLSGGKFKSHTDWENLCGWRDRETISPQCTTTVRGPQSKTLNPLMLSGLMEDAVVVLCSSQVCVCVVCVWSGVMLRKSTAPSQPKTKSKPLKRVEGPHQSYFYCSSTALIVSVKNKYRLHQVCAEYALVALRSRLACNHSLPVVNIWPAPMFAKMTVLLYYANLKLK